MSLKILRTPELRGNNIRKEVIAWRNNLAVVLTRLTPIEFQQFQPGLKQLLPEETGCKTQKGESPMKLTKWWQLGIMRRVSAPYRTAGDGASRGKNL